MRLSPFRTDYPICQVIVDVYLPKSRETAEFAGFAARAEKTKNRGFREKFAALLVIDDTVREMPRAQLLPQLTNLSHHEPH